MIETVPIADLRYKNHQNFFWPSFIICLAGLFFTTLLSPLPFGFVTPVLGAVYFAAYRIIFKKFLELDWGVVIAASLAIALFFLGNLWSVQSEESLRRTCKISMIVAGASLLVVVCRACPPNLWRKYNIFFPLIAFLLGLCCVFNLYSHMQLFRLINQTGSETYVPTHLINKNVSVFTLLLPLSLYLAFKNRSIILGVGLIALAAAIAFKTQSQASQLAMLVMPLAYFGISPFLRRITMRTVFGGLAMFVILAPWLVPIAFDVVARDVHVQDGIFRQASIGKRLEAWDFISRRIHQRPLTGFGLDATRHMQFDSQNVFGGGDRIMHPHNAALQIWIDFGAIGVAGTIGLLIFLYRRLKRADLPGNQAAYKLSRSVPFVTFCGLVVFLLISWSLWASWLVGFILYLAGLLTLAAKTNMSPLLAEGLPNFQPVGHDQKTHRREPAPE